MERHALHARQLGDPENIAECRGSLQVPGVRRPGREPGEATRAHRLRCDEREGQRAD